MHGDGALSCASSQEKKRCHNLLPIKIKWYYCCVVRRIAFWKKHVFLSLKSWLKFHKAKNWTENILSSFSVSVAFCLPPVVTVGFPKHLNVQLKTLVYWLNLQMHVQMYVCIHVRWQAHSINKHVSCASICAWARLNACVCYFVLDKSSNSMKSKNSKPAS